MPPPARTSLPERLFSPRVARPDTLASDLDAIESGDREAVTRVLSSTGKLVAKDDVRAAHGSGINEFIEWLCEPESEPTPSVSRADAIALIDGLQKALYGAADTSRALLFLSTALQQPALSDLIYYPREEFDAARVYELATTLRGTALARFLDPMCGTPPATLPKRPSTHARVVARRSLAAMCVAGEIELASGEEAASGMASLLEAAHGADAFFAWIVGTSNGVAEVFAPDDSLRSRWESAVTAYATEP